MTSRFTRLDRQILRDGEAFAHAVDADAADLIVLVLNALPRLSNRPKKRLSIKAGPRFQFRG